MPALLSRIDYRFVLLGVAFLGLLAGGGLWVMEQPRHAEAIWVLATLPVLAGLIVEIVQSLRRGDVGLDIVAALSMTAAMVFGEYLAAAVVALMYSGGTVLEGFAESRARREMSALLSRVPRSALRHRNGALDEVPLDDIEPGDRLLIRQGDVVPVDGRVAGARATLDQSALTGEAMPVQLSHGDAVMSGATNAGDSFDLGVTRRAEESTYAGIVRLVEAAQQSKAPMSRLADRFSLVLLAVTLVVSGAAWWLTGDPIRAVAVLVVATPCPLILAVPVALVAGLSRAAHFGVLIKGSKALEVLARIQTLILDKTGTLTDGRPQIVAITKVDGFEPDEILHLAASLDQASKHPIAQAIIFAAKEKAMVLAVPEDVTETPGEGVEGTVCGHRVIVGGADFVAAHVPAVDDDAETRQVGSIVVSVAIDGGLAGRIVMADPLRSGTEGFLAGLRHLGMQRILLATGDRRAVAEAVTAHLGLDGVRSELTPDQKVLLVLSEARDARVMMVGDGINDAPALAAADIGVAMGARGAAASAEAADVVLLVDHLDRLLPGIEIAKRARTIALQSVYAGIGLSFAGMIAAAFGYISPVQGAMLQEVIDVAVILNALRALWIEPSELVGGSMQPRKKSTV